MWDRLCFSGLEIHAAQKIGEARVRAQGIVSRVRFDIENGAFVAPGSAIGMPYPYRPVQYVGGLVEDSLWRSGYTRTHTLQLLISRALPDMLWLVLRRNSGRIGAGLD